MIKKVISRACELTLLGNRLQVTGLILLLLVAALLLLPATGYHLPTVYAENCLTQTTNPRADGLISAPDISGSSSKFGNPTGTCVIDINKAAFRPQDIPTYEDLKSLYFTQSKLGPTQKFSVSTDDQSQINLTR